MRLLFLEEEVRGGDNDLSVLFRENRKMVMAEECMEFRGT